MTTYCTAGYKKCLGRKERFRLRDSLRSQNKTHGELGIYRCKACGKFHFTSKKEWAA